MRIALFVVLTLACASDVACAGERFTGFLTFGCGDSYIKPPTVPETWFVELSPSARQEIFRLAKIDDGGYATWWTFHVEIEGRVESKPRPGYFFNYAKELMVERFVAARYPEPGETVLAATEPASAHRGYLILGPESRGFIDEKHEDEYWWVIPRGPASEKIHRYYIGGNSILDKPRLENLLIEFVGAVGPPGGYGHLNDFNREVAIDDFKIVRTVKPEELVGTVAVYDADVPASGVVDINKCKPQRP